jgi:uncharacterized protein (DUF1501 family)
MHDKQFSVLTRRDFIRRAACAAVGTVAMTSTIRDLRFMNAAVAQSNISDYKALVCIFLQGGNDSNNMIIPTSQAQYNYYNSTRSAVLAIPQSAILPVNSLDADGNTYGLHPSCPELQQLFGEGKLAFLFNTGTLVYPITLAQYSANSVARPPQLFSHADQQTQWQTSVPDQPPTTGWGGRCADLLNAVQPGAPISLMVSLAGANTFEVGNIIQQYSVSTGGAISLAMPGTPAYGASTNRLPALMNLLGLPYSNLQAQAYAGVAEQAINTSSLLNNAISNTASANYWTNAISLTNVNSSTSVTGFPVKITPPVLGATAFSSTLSPQLQMVARLIAAGRTAAASGGFGMKRQIFFCQIGGYDLHTGQTNYSTGTPNNVLLGAHTNLLAELSQSMYAFQRAMEQLGLSDSVTAFTASDFGRTFPSNGQGSDHGWGSHHLILGGAVNGQRTYGTFPQLINKSPNDLGTGRWIPTTAIDQYFATLATWFGVDPGNLSTVFPNLGRFTSPNLGFI